MVYNTPRLRVGDKKGGHSQTLSRYCFISPTHLQVVWAWSSRAYWEDRESHSPKCSFISFFEVPITVIGERGECFTSGHQETPGRAGTPPAEWEGGHTCQQNGLWPNPILPLYGLTDFLLLSPCQQEAACVLGSVWGLSDRHFSNPFAQGNYPQSLQFNVKTG